ncbi:potassium-transporting ATPase subunit KdpC [Acinetobacter chinensis]|uniref:Potassium-transporting ATPase KdpC subunit n=1 Tax=Acinetobacter chinensis TaxID=2004650 RepID=A0ABU3WCG4_9GAMM|nr:potassium-transporting ATPase subunit KdpC [Acinetobacter chinensis]MDV2468094.1 potassium-transporting ATPase subunit KdpC [Acinetobacter chinensis]
MNIQNVQTIETGALGTVVRASLGLTVISLGICGFLYSAVATGAGQFIFPHQANGSLIVQNEQIVGSELIAQPFQGMEYFHSRPSASAYDPMAAAGSNMARTNPELQKTIQQRVAEQATLNVVSPHQIPKDLVTASGSGLDPEISVQAAMIQAKRIAARRNVSEQDILTLIAQNTRHPTARLLGTARINVLKLNLLLDQQYGKV